MDKIKLDSGELISPIELVANELGATLAAQDLGDVSDVLVPEACCLVWLGERVFHLTLEELSAAEAAEH